MAPGPRRPLLATAASSLLALAAFAPAAAAEVEPPAAPSASARPLDVKPGPLSSLPAPTATPAPASPGAATGPARLSEAAPDRLSPLCRAAALRLLQRHRRKTALSAAELQEEAEFHAMHLECLHATGAGLTSGAADVGEEVLRAVAQVVLDRARRAAFRLLREKLAGAAGCGPPATPALPAARPGDGTPHFPATCAVLASAPIADLVSSPPVLLGALVSDFLVLLASADASAPWGRIPLLDDALREAAPRFRQAGLPGLTSGFGAVVRRRMKEQVAKPDCELATSALDKALWVSGMCLIEVQQPANFSKCDVDGWASQCTDPITTRRIQALWSLMSELYPAQGKPALSDHVALICASADIALDERTDLSEGQRGEGHEYVAAVKAVFTGLDRKDWIETTSGAVRALRLVERSWPRCAAASGSAECRGARAAERLFLLLSAVGNAAETWAGSSKDAGASREKILSELVDRLVSRSHRDAGFVLSAGGNVGLLGGARTDFATGVEIAFPLQLGLGLGVQSYGAGDRGFHAALTAMDLGQLVSISSGALAVEPPAPASSVALGVTLGAWLGLRETPWYIGVHGGISPFVRAQGEPTYQLGLSTGVYVPLLDFN